MKRWSTMLVIFSLVLTMSVGCGAKKPQEAVVQEKVNPVKIFTVVKGEIQDQVKLGGNLKPNEEVNLVAKYGGRIESIPVSIGDKVKEGQLLVRLESDALNVIQAETNYIKSNDNFKRMEALFNQGAISKQQFEEAESALKVSKAAYDSAQLQQTHTVLKSPINGTVATKNMQVGEMASPSLPVVSVVDIGKVKLEINVTEAYINKIALGQKVEVNIPAAEGVFSATIKTISPVVNQQTKAYPVELVMENKDNKLKSGMYAEANLIVNHRKDILVAAQRALIERNSKVHVFVEKDGVVELREIEVGLKNGVEVEIVKGLAEGENIVTVGQETLINGDKVAVANKGV